ncbi:MAG: low molecular weight protein-tyrosine-phosphatase [Flavobacteriales bacterium]
MKILMVCLGNICRSPMAEGILRARAAERGLAVITDSAGTSDHHVGEAPDLRAQAAMRRRGADISDLRGRQFKAADLERFDHIFAMDRSNLNNILALAHDPTLRGKVRLMMDVVPHAAQTEVPDPYFGGDEGFDAVFDQLDGAINHFLDELEGRR